VTLATVTLQISPGHPRVKSKQWGVSLVTSWSVELQSSRYSERHLTGCRRNEQRAGLWLLVSAYAVHRPDPAGDTRYTPLQCSAVRMHSRHAQQARRRRNLNGMIEPHLCYVTATEQQPGNTSAEPRKLAESTDALKFADEAPS